jgi:ABC-2 type transport system permease protein
VAWLIIVAPYTVAVTVACTALSGDRAAWPWALAVLLAVLGGAAGLAPLASLVSVQPLDETGSPTPAWSLKVHIALVVVAATALLPVLILVGAGLWHQGWLSWAAVPAGLASGAGLAAWLGRRAVARLERQQVRILRVLADAARYRAGRAEHPSRPRAGRNTQPAAGPAEHPAGRRAGRST